MYNKTTEANVEMMNEAAAGQCWIDSDEQENARLLLARAVGQPEPILYEDGYAEYKIKDEISEEEIGVLDAYYTAKSMRETSPEYSDWCELRNARQRAYEEAMSLQDWVHMPADVYEGKLSARLAVVQPTDEQWAKAMDTLRGIKSLCVRHYEDKRTGEMKEDYRGFQGMTRRVEFNAQLHTKWEAFKAAQAACKRFWKSDAGEFLNELTGNMQHAWSMVELCGLEDKRRMYFNLRNESFNLNCVHGEVDPSCDSPELKDEDREYDIPVEFYRTLEGNVSDEEMALLQYVPCGR